MAIVIRFTERTAYLLVGIAAGIAFSGLVVWFLAHNEYIEKGPRWPMSTLF
jgi:hypothetical protein